MNSMTLGEAIRKVIKEKQELLLVKLRPQLDELLQTKTVTQLTAQHFQLAVDNFDKALVELDKGENLYDAMHFFSRGCVNLGELTGRVAKEKKAS